MLAAKAPQAKKAAPAEKPAGQAQGPQQMPINPVWAGLAWGVQAKLSVGAPDDPLEREADAVAERVMRMPVRPEEEETLQRAPAKDSPGTALAFRSPFGGRVVHRLCSECAAEQEEEGPAGPLAQRQPTAAQARAESSRESASPEVAANIDAISQGGSPLPADTRGFFEPRFGADFSQVRVHTGSRASETAHMIHAKAFTVGHHIAFADGQYAPDSQEGRQLLAHELTHTVQQGGSAVKGKPADGNPRPSPKTANPKRIQRAWYNVDIPFTDYQFDPSINGLKNAAGIAKDTVAEGADWVKDKAVSGVEWIYDKIKGLVDSGINWLTEKWESIKAFANSALDAIKGSFSMIVGFIKAPLNIIANAIMNFDPDSLNAAWSQFLMISKLLKDGFKTLTDTLFGQIEGLWETISSYASSLLDSVSSLTENFLFKQLPDFLQSAAHSLINTVKSLWKGIQDGWQALFNKIRSWVDGAIDEIFKFIAKIASFGMDVIVKGILQFGKLVLFLKDLFENPETYLKILGQKSVAAISSAEGYFSSMIGKYFGKSKPEDVGAKVTGTIQRQPEPNAPTETKGSASWSDIGQGVWKVMGDKWAEFKANPWSIVTGLLMDMVLPMVGNVKDIIKLFKDIWKVVSGPLSAGSLEEVWTSFLKLMDIPIMIYHTVVSILMRSLMVPLIVASFVRHPLVTAIASAVGEALLAAFVESELLNIGHKLLLLKTGATNKAEKAEAYNRVADSLIAFAMAAAVALVMFILHFIGNIIKGVFNFIKGKVFPPEAGPVKAKTSTPGEAKPVEPTETKPAEPAETKPAEPAETKPAEPAETKPAEPAEAKPAEPAEAKPAEEAKAKDDPSSLDELPGEATPETLKEARAMCFPQGTLVSTPSGRMPIESIRPGDFVHAYDQEGQAVVASRVIALVQGSTHTWTDIHVGDAILRATPNHPIWVESEADWICAEDLVQRMVLRMQDGGLCEVSQVETQALQDLQPTYNLCVENHHSFFVSELEILVHNEIPKEYLARLARPGYRNYYLRAGGPNGEIYYSGMFGPGSTPQSVQYRHGKNHDRFNPENGDYFDLQPGERTYGESRLMEHQGAVENETIIGRDANTWRGNREDPINAEKLEVYEEYVEGVKSGECA